MSALFEKLSFKNQRQLMTFSNFIKKTISNET